MKPKKSLGQHFLNSNKIIDRIVAAGKLSPKDTVLEIGPGKGVLTKALLESGTRVVAVEKDGDLIGYLRETFGEQIGERQLMLLHTDVLGFNPIAQGLSEHHYKIIANIPYYITGEIIRRFLSEVAQPAHMVLLIQKEVAERIVAKDGKESILSLSVKLYGRPSIVARVPRKFFSPAPDVDSAVLSIEDIHRPGLSKQDEVRFFTLVKMGFSQKRKQVVPLLSKEVKKEKLVKLLAEHGLPATARAEDMPLPAWLELTKTL